MNKLMSMLLELLYPREKKCCLCGMAAEDVLCDKCTDYIPYLNGVVCLNCGKQLNESYESNICPDCRNTKYWYDIAYSCFEYKGSGKELIHKLKYEGKVDTAIFIAKQMYFLLRNEKLDIDAIVPVPIHESKLKTRGFNQSYVIAEGLARLMDKPIVDCLERKRETQNQYNLDRTQRFLNIADAFSIKLMYNVNKNKRLLLLDDIYTTGSTVNECSRVLKANGAEYVCVVTAATGTNT